ncbi:hypothetical protein [Foetidibacter luteolus]|uniref:hypothetical protein n=1 Tax=Foetidibacter luteolus TaxID=2608880 RepID=UPI00129A9ADF|nr:hypothetical protein [Foetidibacter luteolus]
MSKFLLICAVTAACCTTAVHASSIVVIVTPTSVILGADSRGTFIDLRTLKPEKRKVSKIHQAGNFYFALCGLTQNSMTNFDAARVISNYLQRQATLHAAVEAMSADLCRLLSIELKRQQQLHAALFAKSMEYRDNILSIAIIGCDSVRPIARLVNFSIQNMETLLVKAEQPTGALTGQDNTRAYCFGETAAINHYMQHNSETVEPLNLVEKLIKLEAEDQPRFVGGPIDILEVKAGQAIWHKKKRGCPVQEYSW